MNFYESIQLKKYESLSKYSLISFYFIPVDSVEGGQIIRPTTFLYSEKQVKTTLLKVIYDYFVNEGNLFSEQLKKYNKEKMWGLIKGSLNKTYFGINL